MTDGSTAVDSFLDGLEHAQKEGLLRLRTTILGSDPGFSEHVKWNAPSFVYAGVDRITFRLRPGNILQLIFHRGSSVRADVGTFTFEDPTGLLAWQAPDRGVMTFASLADVESTLEDVEDLARRWVQA